MSYLMGIDVGTTGTKTVLVDEEGAVIAGATASHELDVPRAGWSEQDPEEWWRATQQTIREVLAHPEVDAAAVKAVGLSGQMHGLVLLDAQHRVLRPCILWNDQRSAPQCRQITERIGYERLLEIACNPALPGFTAGKVLWVREHEPHIWDQAAMMLLPKDYVRFRLTGGFATEVSDASGTLFLDIKRRAWSREILDTLDLDLSLLPECYESPVVSGQLSELAARATGLPAGTPVVGGGGDNAAGAVGVGIVEPGVILASLGTSGVVFASSDSVQTDPEGRVHTFCHAVPGLWHVMGVMLSAGGSLRWFRDVLGGEEVREAEERGVDPYEILMEKAGEAAAASEGLLFLPYLSGERTPHADPYARGVLFGLSLRHRRPDVIRAVIEGVTFGMRDSLEIIRAMGLSATKIRAAGGGAQSAFWRQLQADVYGVSVETVNITEGGAFGAALLAGTGAGIYQSVEEACRTTIRTGSLTSPRDKVQELYEGYYRQYRSLYPALAERFQDLAVWMESEGAQVAHEKGTQS